MSSDTVQDADTGPQQPVLQIGAGADGTLPAQDVVTGRGMVSGVSGAGKSNTAVVVAEEVLELGIPLVVLDPEGEFIGLREEYPVVVFGRQEDADTSGDAAAAADLARRAVAESLPVVFDLVEFSEEEAEEIAAAVSNAVFAAERRHETPLLFIVDELDEYVPEKGKTDASKPIKRVAQRGRKRGLGILGVSQRPVGVSKDFVTQADYHLWHRLRWENDTELAAKHLPDGYEDVLTSLEDGEAILNGDWGDDVSQFYVRLKRVRDLGATPSITESLGSVPEETPEDLPQHDAGDEHPGEYTVTFDPGNADLVEQAASDGSYGTPEAFITHAAVLKAADVADVDGHLECTADGCDETFHTEIQLNGHIGAAHSQERTESDFWCGHCGHGPTTWRGVAAHHGSAGHDGEVVQLDEEPSRDDLLSPDDVPDHKNPELLERLYEEHDGSYTDMCRAHDFEVSPGRVRHYLVEFGIHEVTPQGAAGDDGPKYRDPEWLQEQYEKADGNISEMYRNVEDEIDAAYRTLQKNLKRFDIHDPTDPPGKKQAWENREKTPVPGDNGDDADDEATDADDEPSEDLEDDQGDQDVDLDRELDHDDPEDLREAFEAHDTISEAAEAFPDASYGTVRNRLIDHGIYQPDSYGSDSDEADDSDESPADAPEPDPEPEPASESAAEPEPEPEPVEEDSEPDDDLEDDADDVDVLTEVLLVETPDDVDGFGDVATPDWLDEGTFYGAAEMAEDVGEFADVLGWHEYDRLEVLVGLLDVDVEGGEAYA